MLKEDINVPIHLEPDLARNRAQSGTGSITRFRFSLYRTHTTKSINLHRPTLVHHDLKRKQSLTKNLISEYDKETIIVVWKINRLVKTDYDLQIVK